MSVWCGEGLISSICCANSFLKCIYVYFKRLLFEPTFSMHASVQSLGVLVLFQKNFRVMFTPFNMAAAVLICMSLNKIWKREAEGKGR